MKRKILYIFLGVVLIAVVVPVCVYFYGLRTGVPGTADSQKLQLKNPAVMGMLESVADGSITIKLQDNGLQTFTISSSTRVVTQVQAGEIGKSAAQITVGTFIMVKPSDVNAKVVETIGLMPTPPTNLNTDPLGPPASASGIVVSKTATSITIASATDPKQKILLDKETVYISNVLAGQKGIGFDDIKEGMQLQIQGISTAKGIVARYVFPVVPLQ